MGGQLLFTGHRHDTVVRERSHQANTFLIGAVFGNRLQSVSTLSNVSIPTSSSLATAASP